MENQISATWAFETLCRGQEAALTVDYAIGKKSQLKDAKEVREADAA